MSDFYEDSQTLSEYLLFHYGEPSEILPWSFGPSEAVDFPKRIAHLFQPHYPPAREGQKLRALDLGCAVGRSSFELTRWFDEVIGIDYSHTFVKAAQELQQQGSLTYDVKIQGNQRQPFNFKIPADVNPQKAVFRQGDAMQFGSMDLGFFDLIVASNLICRLPDPGAFLRAISDQLSSGGVFILSTPYSYLDTYTDESKWLGGQTDGSRAPDAIASVLGKNLEKVAETDTPMLIREHERKFQWTVCHVTAWKK